MRQTIDAHLQTGLSVPLWVPWSASATTGRGENYPVVLSDSPCRLGAYCQRFGHSGQEAVNLDSVQQCVNDAGWQGARKGDPPPDVTKVDASGSRLFVTKTKEAMMTKTMGWLGAMTVSLATVACLGPLSPSDSPVAGYWTGTMTSANWGAIAVAAHLTGSEGEVTGAWENVAGVWNGTIVGKVREDRFTGSLSISSPSWSGVGPGCTGEASVSGIAMPDGETILLTSSGFTGSCDGFPNAMTLRLERETVD